MAYFWNPELDKERRLQELPEGTQTTPKIRGRQRTLPKQHGWAASIRSGKDRAKPRSRKRQGPR